MQNPPTVVAASPSSPAAPRRPDHRPPLSAATAAVEHFNCNVNDAIGYQCKIWSTCFKWNRDAVKVSFLIQLS
ncbi:hypothetical protein Fmac_011122 [Flemingia macrophylla]|uniref:Uncharacterized protein n=1 Tax=Flemingia macrophylla TaxID=520843 RepID=A0ABD1MLU7_9FABA